METENVKRKGFNGRISVATRFGFRVTGFGFNSKLNTQNSKLYLQKGGGSHFIIKDI